MINSTQTKTNKVLFLSSKLNTLKIQMSFIELIFVKVFRCQSKKLLFLNIAENYIKHKIGIEQILSKLYDIDKLKFLLFNSEICILMKHMALPHIFKKKECIKLNLDQENDIQDFYTNFEFFKLNNNINEDAQSFENLSIKDNRSEIEEKILKNINILD
jgi:hypothetical protein